MKQIFDFKLSIVIIFLFTAQSKQYDHISSEIICTDQLYDSKNMKTDVLMLSNQRFILMSNENEGMDQDESLSSEKFYLGYIIQEKGFIINIGLHEDIPIAYFDHEKTCSQICQHFLLNSFLNLLDESHPLSITLENEKSQSLNEKSIYEIYSAIKLNVDLTRKNFHEIIMRTIDCGNDNPYTQTFNDFYNYFREEIKKNSIDREQKIIGNEISKSNENMNHLRNLGSIYQSSQMLISLYGFAFSIAFFRDNTRTLELVALNSTDSTKLSNANQEINSPTDRISIFISLSNLDFDIIYRLNYNNGPNTAMNYLIFGPLRDYVNMFVKDDVIFLERHLKVNISTPPDDVESLSVAGFDTVLTYNTSVINYTLYRPPGSLESSDYRCWVQIEKCVIERNGIYNLTFTRTSSDEPLLSKTVVWQFRALPDAFTLEMVDRNIFHKNGVDLLIHINAVVPEGWCNTLSDSPSFSFSFTCMKKASGQTEAPCNDPSNLFTTPKTTSNLTIPSSYFTSGDIITIQCTASYDGITQTVSGFFEISTQDAVTLEFRCSYGLCKNYIPTKDLYINVKPKDPTLSFDYAWTVNPDSDKNVWIGSTLYVPAKSDFSGSTLKITAKIAGVATDGLIDMTLRVSEPPRGGDFSLAQDVEYELPNIMMIKNWVDEDLPLRYQVYGSNYQDIRIILSQMTTSKTINFTPLGNIKSNKFEITLEVYDNIATMSSLTKKFSVDAFSVNVLSFYGVITQRFSTGLRAQSNALANVIYLGNIQIALASAEYDFSKQNNCTCSTGSFKCVDYMCSCTALNSTTTECEMDESTYRNINSSKIYLMGLLNASYFKAKEYIASQGSSSNPLDDLTNTLMTSTLASMYMLTQTSFFTTTSVLSTAHGILDDAISPPGQEGIDLTNEQALIYAKLVGKGMSTIQLADCDCETPECKALENRTMSSILQISTGLLYNQLASQPQQSIITDEYDLVTLKSRACELDGLTVNLSSLAPRVVFSQTVTTGLDCNKVIDIVVLAVASRFYYCDEIKYKDRVMIDTTDSETSKPATFPDLKVQLYLPSPDLECDKYCLDKITYCECDISFFDFKTNFNLLFRNSGFQYLGDASALLSWDAVGSPVFWSNIVVFFWFSTHLLALAFIPGLMAFCIMTKIDSLAFLLKSKAIVYAYIINHGVASLYAVSKKDDLSKTLRTCIYYGKICLYATTSALFANAGLHNGLIKKLENNEFYVIFVPYFFVIPVNLIFTIIIKKLFNQQKFKKPGQIKMFKILALVFVFIFAFGCLYIMFVISASAGEIINDIWLQTFLVNIIQDMTIAPAIGTLIDYHAFKFSKIVKNKKIQKKLDGMVNEHNKVIYVKYFDDLLNSKSKVDNQFATPVKSNKVKPIKSQTLVINSAGTDITSERLNIGSELKDQASKNPSEEKVHVLDV